MSTCKIDHTNSEVRDKLISQNEFLPQPIFEGLTDYLQKSLSQQELNELFHLLKKYDLSTSEEQEARNLSMRKLITQSE